MILKMVRVLVVVVLLFLSLVFPTAILVSAKSASKHRNPVAGSSLKAKQNIKATPSDELRHDHQHTATSLGSGSTNKEQPLVRLKRIKREESMLDLHDPKAISIDKLQNNERLNHHHHHHQIGDQPLKILAKTAKADDVSTRLKYHQEGKLYSIGQGIPAAFDGGSRSHAELVRKLEDAHRNSIPRRKGGKTRERDNEIKELGHGRPAKIRMPTSAATAGGGVESSASLAMHQKHEHDSLERIAAEATALRQKHRKKTKQQKNKSELESKVSKSKLYPSAHHRIRPGVNAMGSSRGGSTRFDDTSDGHYRRLQMEPGNTELKVKHGFQNAKTGEGSLQRSTMGLPSSHSTAVKAQSVRVELERIKRMQRDLLREISRLERMKMKKKKKKKKRSAQLKPKKNNKYRNDGKMRNKK